MQGDVRQALRYFGEEGTDTQVATVHSFFARLQDFLDALEEAARQLPAASSLP